MSIRNFTFWKHATSRDLTFFHCSFKARARHKNKCQIERLLNMHLTNNNNIIMSHSQSVFQEYWVQCFLQTSHIFQQTWRITSGKWKILETFSQISEAQNSKIRTDTDTAYQIWSSFNCRGRSENYKFWLLWGCRGHIGQGEHFLVKTSR